MLVAVQGKGKPGKAAAERQLGRSIADFKSFGSSA
jgi:hypothetical protein